MAGRAKEIHVRRLGVRERPAAETLPGVHERPASGEGAARHG